MAALLDQFTKIYADGKQRVAASKPPLNALCTYLDEGETCSFPTDERFKLRSESTVLFAFGANWSPWSDSEDPGSQNSPIPVIQYGSETEPGSGYSICVTRELDALVIKSGKNANKLVVNYDFRDGAYVTVFFNRTTKVFIKGKSFAQGETHLFKMGEVSGLPTLTLGNSADDTPFAGTVGFVLLFDRDISDALLSAEHGPAGQLYEAALNGNPQRVFDLYSRGSADSAVLSLLGIAYPGEPVPRFDFIPREIMRPGSAPAAKATERQHYDRWMLAGGNMKPLHLNIPGAEDGDHAVHSTNCVYCFVRIGVRIYPQYTAPGGVYLWGDQGQRFLITYLGQNKFGGVPEYFYGWTVKEQPITLTYIPTPEDPTQPGRMLIETTGWKNSTEHVFPSYVVPEGATLPHEIGQDVIWQDKLTLNRIPADYRIISGVKKDMTEQWSGAFTKSLCNISANMQGWDISKLDNPLSIGDSTAAVVEYTDSILDFPPADSYQYRAEAGSFMPYYCTVTNQSINFDVTKTVAHTSATEVSQTISNSTHLGLEVGEGKGAIDGSFSKVRGSGINSSEDHAIVTNVKAEVYHSLVLEKQWLQFNPGFLKVLREKDAKTPEDLYTVFNQYGTHYANAVAYGVGHYSIAFIDESGAGTLATIDDSSKDSLKIPVENCFLNLSSSTEEKNTNKTNNIGKTEVKTAAEIGTESRLAVMRIDLRPISDLIQPPYFGPDDLELCLTLRPLVEAGIGRYLSSRPKDISEGNILYQVRLVSLENTNNSPCYFSARMFMVGILQADESDSFMFPQIDSRLIQPFWCKSIRLEAKGDPSATHKAASDGGFATFKNLSISRQDGSLFPQVRMTGRASVVYEDAIENELTVYPPDPPLWLSPEGGNPYAPPKYPSKQQIRSMADSLGTVRVEGDTGVDWYPWATSSSRTDVVSFGIKCKLTLSDLPDSGVIHEVNYTVGGVKVTIFARKVDLLKCFQPPANTVWGLPPGAIPKPKPVAAGTSVGRA